MPFPFSLLISRLTSLSTERLSRRLLWGATMATGGLSTTTGCIRFVVVFFLVARFGALDDFGCRGVHVRGVQTAVYSQKELPYHTLHLLVI